jgi:hypothetical protein
MSKLNGFEKSLINDGLDKVQADMIAEIEKAEQSGKTPFMTVGFVEMTISDLKLKMKLNK